MIRTRAIGVFHARPVCKNAVGGDCFQPGKLRSMKAIHAFYENGVFRPVEAVDLPDRCYVEFEPRIVDAPSISPEPGRGVCGPA
jgi:hypothetical protein